MADSVRDSSWSSSDDGKRNKRRHGDDKQDKCVEEGPDPEPQQVKQLRLESDGERLQRDEEAEQYKTWQEQDKTFLLLQEKMRSKIRIRDGRAKPIDLLAKYISTAEEDILSVGMHEPYTFLTGLTVSDLEDLLEDIQIYMELEQGKNVDFWRDMTTITEDEISKLRKLESSGKGPGERQEGVNSSVSTDVQAVFTGKTYIQLQLISQGIESKIKAEGPNLDICYWESLLQQLRVHIARARRRERHQELLRRKLFKLKQEQGVETELESPGDSEPLRRVKEAVSSQQPGSSTAAFKRPKGLDLRRFVLLKQQMQAMAAAIESPEDFFIRKAKEGMDGDEAQFSVEIPVTSKAYLWADKYRPRKPHYFNRVHTGFEWNKYNQTHYEFENPPPKIVQGYKFNIFYPDLIDKRSTPDYFLDVCKDNKEFLIISFRAGPPYEDIAFKIVCAEWEYSQRHGFRCQFSNGIFQLWFYFKRYRYRR